MKRPSRRNTPRPLRPQTTPAPRAQPTGTSPGGASQPCSWIAIGLLGVITLVFFGDLLFAPGETVLSQHGTDVYYEFVYTRAFGFGELRRGNLPLWNPYLFAGTPFFGGFQSALLYPLNWLYLVLPLAVAINVSIALHVWLSGSFMYLWGRQRGLRPFAALVCGILFMFCGPHFLHIYAGHLSNLCTIIWVPVLFTALDALARQPRVAWILLGSGAVAMQMLAGHPQYVFYTAVTAGVYSLLCMVNNPHWRRIGVGLGSIYVGAACLSAVQMLTGMDAGTESIRSGGVSQAFAALFSLPPENILTLLAPGFFGDMTAVPYWGRGYYLWEMSLFISVTGLVLALYGAVYVDRPLRRRCGTMIVVALVLAFGAHTPLFKVLYDLVPGFDMFRGSAKFSLFVALFLIVLAGHGLDTLWNTARSVTRLSLLLAGVTLVCTAVAGGLYVLWHAGGDAGWWAGILHAMHQTQETSVSLQTIHTPGFLASSGTLACKSLLMAALISGLLGGLCFCRRYTPKVVYLIGLLAVGEILLFARAYRATFDLTSTRMVEVEQLAHGAAPEDRMLNLVKPNLAMISGLGDIWGHDPGVLKRYAQFIAFTQGQHPDEASQYVTFSRYHPLYKMLRCRYIITRRQEGVRVHTIDGSLPRTLLVDGYQVLPARDHILAAMQRPHYDPQRTVILEQQPVPRPVQGEGSPGTVVSTVRSTDELRVEAELHRPAILLLTDAYSTGWHARPLLGSVQQDYTILPANYALMAVPLAAGRHQFVLVYAPLAFRIGTWLSLLALAGYLSGVGWLVYQRLGSKAH